jgi:CRP-like cAMP-binding protein
MEEFLKRIAWTEPLLDNQRQRLLGSVAEVRSFAPGEEIVPAHKAVDFSCVLLNGLACRQKLMRSGERQITAFHLTGDFCDLHTYILKTLNDSVVAITPCRVGLVPHRNLDAIVEELPHVARLLWKSTLIDAAVYRRWLVCLGRQTPLSRLAHLFCELFLRLRLVGVAENCTFPLPVTQTDLSDAMGLSLVHTNRTCGALREKRLANFAQRSVTIHDWDGLRDAAEFDATYLHLDPTL